MGRRYPPYGTPWWVWWYPSVWYTLVGMVGIHSLVYARVYIPGYTTTLPWSGATPAVSTQRCVTRPWALSGRFPWVRPLSRLKVLKGVKGEGSPLRINLCSLREETDERLDRHRVTIDVSPMVRVSCAQWSIRSFIRSLMSERDNDAHC